MSLLTREGRFVGALATRGGVRVSQVDYHGFESIITEPSSSDKKGLMQA